MSYRSYWTRVVLQALEVQRGNLSVKDISELTAIRADDIVKTLESLSLIKYWKVRTSAADLFSTPMPLHTARFPSACGLGLRYNYHAHDAATSMFDFRLHVSLTGSLHCRPSVIRYCYELLLHAVATAWLSWLTARSCTARSSASLPHHVAPAPF